MAYDVTDIQRIVKWVKMFAQLIINYCLFRSMTSHREIHLLHK